MNVERERSGLVAVVVILVLLLILLPSAGGTINCTNVTGANGWDYGDDRIPAIRLFSGLLDPWVITLSGQRKSTGHPGTLISLKLLKRRTKNRSGGC